MIDFDGTLYNLYPQPETVERVLKLFEEKNLVDLRIGRKLPSYFTNAGFQAVYWRIDTIECHGESMRQEIELMEGRLENFKSFLMDLLQDKKLTEQFVTEYLDAMKDPRAVLFYNKFIVSGKKPESELKLIK